MTELKGQLQEDIAESGTHIEQPVAEPRQHSGKEIRDAIRLAIPEQDDEPKVLATAHITVEKNHGGIHIYQAGSEGPSINGPRKKSVEEMSGHELAIERARQDFKANMDSNRDILINKKIEQIGQEAYNNLPAAEKYKIQKAAETKAYSEYATATGNRERALLLAEVDDRMQAELDKKAKQKASRDQKKTAVPAAQFNAPIKEGPRVHSPISPTAEPDMSRGMNPDDTSTDDAERRESPDGATFSDDVVPDEETAIPAPIDTSTEPTTPGSAPVAPDSKDNAGSNTPIDAPVEDTEDEDMNISKDDEATPPAPINTSAEHTTPIDAPVESAFEKSEDSDLVIKKISDRLSDLIQKDDSVIKRLEAGETGDDIKEEQELLANDLKTLLEEIKRARENGIQLTPEQEALYRQYFEPEDNQSEDNTEEQDSSQQGGAEDLPEPAPLKALDDAIEQDNTEIAEAAIQNATVEELHAAKKWIKEKIWNKKNLGKMLMLLVVYLSIELTLVAKTASALKK